MLMQDEYLTCVSCRMNCKLLLSYFLYYQGVLVLTVRTTTINMYITSMLVSTFSSYQCVWIVELITILTQYQQSVVHNFVDNMLLL